MTDAMAIARVKPRTKPKTETMITTETKMTIRRTKMIMTMMTIPMKITSTKAMRMNDSLIAHITYHLPMNRPELIVPTIFVV